MKALFPSPGRRSAIAVLGATHVVFAVVVAYLALWLRSGLREQILQREAAALTEVAALQLANEAEAFEKLGVKDAPGELLGAVLKTSRLRGVFAVRVFDTDRKFGGAVPPWSESPPSDQVWEQLVSAKPYARLHPRDSASEVIELLETGNLRAGKEPVLETWLPLRRGAGDALAGAAQLWTDGEAISAEFAALDRRLLTQAVFAWGAGAGIISLLLVWAFRQLEAANQALRSRTDDLARANRELTLAAKTSALGAVAAHLMHELKNPVAGLEEFVATRTETTGGADNGGELAAASELTRRLRTMINDVVGVLRDEQPGAAEFSLSGNEIVELVVKKVREFSRALDVDVVASGQAEASLAGRRANLVMLVLTNLAQNAIEASPAKESVTLSVASDGHALRFAVEDRGPGISPSVRQQLFQPTASTKRGGSGLGLALSQHLARQAGGKIELIRTSSDGTRFELILEREP